MWNWKNREDYLAEVADLLAHPEVCGMEELPQHAPGVSCLHHSLLVSYFSFRLCRRLGLDARAAARGGLLHDFYLYNWQDKATHPDVSHAFDHPLVALENARARFPLTPKEEDIIATLEEQYQGQKKGVFLSNDTLASTLLNLLFRKYGHLPEDYRIVGFDNSPASREAIIPISTVGQQVDKLAQEAVGLVVEQINARKEGRPLHSRKPVHKIIEPVLVRRASTEGWTEER